jgi:tetratricopeptide (TPR) repeat protein
MLSDNLCDNPILESCFALLIQLCGDAPRFRTSRLTTSVVFNTSIGDLSIALRDAGELIEIAREQGPPALLGRALRFATAPHRTCGNFERATEFVSEALRIAERYRLAEDAAFSCDILATMELERGDVDEARAWARRAYDWAQRVDTAYWRLSAGTLRARLALADGDPGSALKELGTSIEACSTDPMIRQGLICLSIIVAALRLQGRHVEMKRALKGMRGLFPRIIRRGRVDPYVEEYVLALNAIGRRSEAQEFLRSYLSNERRDRHANPRLLALKN